MRISEISIEKQLAQSAVETPALHPEQQKVIDLLEEYPATHFHMTFLVTPVGGPAIGTDSAGEPVCFSCIAGWTNGFQRYGAASAEIARLMNIASHTSARAATRMRALIYSSNIIPKAECIALVRDIFMDAP